MKKVLPFTGIIAAGIAIVAFILMLATPAITQTVGGATITYPGTTAIFGGQASTGIFNYKPAGVALAAWIMVLIAILALIAGFLLVFLKVKAVARFAGLINLCAAVLLIVAGVLAFFVVLNFVTSNGGDAEDAKNYAIGAGWVFVGILSIVAGACAALPGIFNLVSKK